MNALKKLFQWFKRRGITPQRLENIIIERKEYDQFKMMLLNADGELIKLYEFPLRIGNRINFDFIEDE
jgi:hypothetical protein